jgi:maleylacetate reductase
MHTTPFSDAVSAEALTLLSRALPTIKAAPQNLEARADGQIGMWLSISGAGTGVGVGVSHAIGHTLGGSYGIPHGITSCLTLPAALRWNAKANHQQQRKVSRIMGTVDQPAADLVADLVHRLGLPHRLRDVGIRKEDLPAIAEHTMHDAPVRTNPRPIDRPADIVEILELAW